MTENIKINTLKSLLPNSPFVVEQVGFALKFAQETGKDLTDVLDQAILLTEYANKFSNPNFYAYRPIVCALLSVVDDEDKLTMFATETNSVLTTLAEYKQFQAEFNSNLKQACCSLAKAIMNNSDVVVVCLTYLIKAVEKGEEISLLRSAYISVDLRLNGFELTGAKYEAYNKLLIAIHKANF